MATVQAHERRKSMSIRIRGRTITEVLLPDGTTVNPALVKEGWCVNHKRIERPTGSHDLS